jgi:arylsulfatase A-like enzyme
MCKSLVSRGGNKTNSHSRMRREPTCLPPIRFSRHLLSAGGLLCFSVLGGKGEPPHTVDAKVALDTGSAWDTQNARDQAGSESGSSQASLDGNAGVDAELADVQETPDAAPLADVHAADASTGEETGPDGAGPDGQSDSPGAAGAESVEAGGIAVDAGNDGANDEGADAPVVLDDGGIALDVGETRLDGTRADLGVDCDDVAPDSAGNDGADAADLGDANLNDGPPDGNGQSLRQPNILVIVADDFGYSDIHASGSEIDTPNLDALVGNGCILTNFHTGSVSAVTRSMLISGTDHHLVGLGSQFYEKDDRQGLPGYEGYLNAHALSIADLLKDAGYHTYIAGKWHLGSGISGSNPNLGKTADQWGFEKSYTLLGAAAMNHFAHEAANSHNYAENGAYVQPGQPGQPGGAGGSPAEFFSTNFYTQKLIEYIDANHGTGKDNKPFFAYAAYTAAHTPLQVPEPWLSQYEGVYDNGYQPIREARFARMKQLGVVPQDAVMYPGAPETLTQSPATANWDSATNAKPITAVHSPKDGYVDYHEGFIDKQWASLTAKEKKAQARYMEIYAGMVANLDYNVGLLIQHLKDIGEYDRTFIIFHSDNGPEGIANGKGADPKALDEANAAAGVYETLGKDNGQQKVDPFIMYGLRWAEVSATPFAQVKSYLGEGSTSVPAIVHLPGQTQPTPPLSVFTHVIDEAATFLALAGVDPPSQPAAVKYDAGTGPTERMVVYKGRNVFPLTGVSLLPVLKGDSTDIVRTEGQFGDEIYGRASVYSKDLRWKARWTEPPIGPTDGHWELFDLNADRGETTDVSAQHAQFMNTLFGQWQDYMSKVGGVEPICPNAYF